MFAEVGEYFILSPSIPGMAAVILPIVLRRSALWYINDEATANVAPENEADLMNAVEELTKEKTIIMIAHRLKTVRKADQILVIEKGRIAEQGTHDVLLQKNGIYSSFICSRKEAVSWKVQKHS